MNKFQNFILKHDRTVVMLMLAVLPSLIVLLAFMPMLIENYTFNAFLNGERDNYLEMMQGFKCMYILVFIYMAIGVCYNMIRRCSVQDITDKTGPYFNGINFIVAFSTAIAITIAIFVINSTYENKNIAFVSSKIIDIKKYIQNGKCDVVKKSTDPTLNDEKFKDVSNCSSISTKLPGTIFYRESGTYSSLVSKDGAVEKGIKDEPNTIVYQGHFAPFCRSLGEKDNVIYKEFSSVLVNGVNTLSDDFKQRYCEEYKGIGQIQFIFK